MRVRHRSLVSGATRGPMEYRSGGTGSEWIMESGGEDQQTEDARPSCGVAVSLARRVRRSTALLGGCVLAVLCILAGESVSAQAALRLAQVDLSEDARLAAAKLELAQANRILANEGILDALGHVSVRDPTNPNRFLISRQLSAALVTPKDIVAVDLNGDAVSPE